MRYLFLESLSVCDFFFFASRRRHTRFDCDWSSDVCSSDLPAENLYFDVSVATLPGSLQGIAPLAISPPVAGTQYLYLGWMNLDGSGNLVTNVDRKSVV